MENLEFICDTQGVRIDKYIEIDGVTRSQVQKLIEEGNIIVNGNTVKTNYKLKANDVIEVTLPDPEYADITPEDIHLDIVYEDSSLLVINKPQGMVVHPAPGNYSGTLVNALMFHCKDDLSGINGVMRPGIVHRIDKDTSGLLLVAKTNEAHLSLAEQIKDKTVKREYECIVSGNLTAKKGTVDAPIGRHPTSRLKMAVTPKNSKHAVTHFEVIQFLNDATHLCCRLETGRTHQIRVHMQYMGHPVLGDPVYANKNPYNLIGQALHAKTIGFVHPVTNEYMEFTKPAPDYFYELIEKLK